MMLCNRCHQKLSQEVQFCNFCGKKNPIPSLSATFRYAFLPIPMIIISLFIVFTIYSTINYSGVLGNFSSYSDSENAIEVSYLIHWEYEEEPGNNTIVAFRPPKSSTTNSHEAGLSVTVDNLYFTIPLNDSLENGTLNTLPSR